MNKAAKFVQWAFFQSAPDKLTTLKHVIASEKVGGIFGRSKFVDTDEAELSIEMEANYEPPENDCTPSSFSIRIQSTTDDGSFEGFDISIYNHETAAELGEALITYAKLAKEHKFKMLRYIEVGKKNS